MHRLKPLSQFGQPRPYHTEEKAFLLADCACLSARVEFIFVVLAEVTESMGLNTFPILIMLALAGWAQD